MKYPNAWPILDKTSIRRNDAGEYKSGYRCLLGWCREVFIDTEDEAFYPTKKNTKGKKFVNGVCDTIVDAIKEELSPQKVKSEASAFTVISYFNDNYKPEQVARVWNRTGEMLGYTEIVDLVDGDWRNA